MHRHDSWNEARLVYRDPSLCSVCALLFDAPGSVVDAYEEAGIAFDALIAPFERELTERWRDKVLNGKRADPGMHNCRYALADQRVIGQSVRMVHEVARPKLSGVDHVGLSVTDLDRSISFYCDDLGALVTVPPFEGYRGFSGRMAIVLLGLTIVDLYEHEANRGESFEPSRTGLDHLALAADSYDEVDAWVRWLDSRGIPHSDVRDSSGFGALFDFVDPDGIQIEISFLDRDMLRQASTALTEARDRNTRGAP